MTKTPAPTSGHPFDSLPSLSHLHGQWRWKITSSTSEYFRINAQRKGRYFWSTREWSVVPRNRAHIPSEVESTSRYVLNRLAGPRVDITGVYYK